MHTEAQRTQGTKENREKHFVRWMCWKWPVCTPSAGMLWPASGPSFLISPELLWTGGKYGTRASRFPFTTFLLSQEREGWWAEVKMYFMLLSSSHASMKWNVPQHSQGFAKRFWCGQRLPRMGWKVGRQWKMRECSGADFLWYYHAYFAVTSKKPCYQEAKQRNAAPEWLSKHGHRA